MGPISISGAVSGLDWQSIIDRMMSIEQQPIKNLQTRQATWQADKGIWSDLATKLGDLDAAVQALQSSSTWNAVAFASSNSNAVDGTVQSNATPATYTINVSALAQAQKVASDAQASTTASLGLQGTFTINGVPIQVAATDTLNSLAARINAATSSGVTATIVGSQLVLTSANTGAANTMKLVDSVAGQYLTTSDNTAVAWATADTTATPGTYTVNVTQLAQKESVASDPGTTPGVTGSFTINGVSVSVLAGDTLSTVASKINQANAGVTASVDSQNRLVITANNTGAASAISFSDPNGILANMGVLTTTGAVKNLLSAAQDAQFTINGTAYSNSTNTVSGVITGMTFNLLGTGTANITVSTSTTNAVLQSLGVLTSTGTVKNQLVAAQDAAFTVDGISLTSPTNTVTTAISGVTLNLKAVTTSPVTVTVSQDTQKITQAVQNFVDKYNAAWSLIEAKLAKGAELQGDFTLTQLEQRLRQLVSTTVSGLPSSFNDLSDIGITTTGKDGTLTVDTAKVSNAIATNKSAVQNMFSSTQSGVTPLGVQFDNLLKSYTDPISGIITLTKQGLDAQINDANDQIANMQRLLDMRKQYLQQQFIAMESMISMLQGQASALSRMPQQPTRGV